MPDWEDLYEILGVDPEASAEDIRRAYIRKARDYHPDMLRGASVEELRLSEEKMKKVNKAYETLRFPEKRRLYHISWASRRTPPQPEVQGSSLVFTDATPQHRYTGYFIVRNVGGPCTRISIRNPDSWVKVTGYQPLGNGGTLPLRVDIEAEGKEWGKSYSETVVISLDDQQAYIRIELYTRPLPETYTSSVSQAGVEIRRRDSTQSARAQAAPHRGNRILQLQHSTQMRELSLYTYMGRVVGAIFGICAGLFFTVVIAVDGASMFPSILLAAVVVGIVSGTFSAVILLPAGLLIGLILGWAVGFAVWMVHNAIETIGRRI